LFYCEKRHSFLEKKNILNRWGDERISDIFFRPLKHYTIRLLDVPRISMDIAQCIEQL
jgi:hypothetical protein